MSILEWFLTDRDAEDWSNDAENTAFVTEINCSYNITIENSFLLNCNNISQYFTVFLIK